MFVASVSIFLILRLVPGDPAQIALGTNATPELVAQTRREFGLDQPLILQYWQWISGIPFGNFGTSFVTGQDISPQIIDRVQVTLILVLLAITVALLIAIPMGTFAAVRHGKVSGLAISGASQVLMAVPGFLAGIILVAVFAVQLRWLPANGWAAPIEGAEFLSHAALPVLALASVQAAILTRYVRSAVLEVMNEDFLRTARAKGLSPMGALFKHGLRNAAIPVLTVTSVQFAALIIGAVVVERVFVIPGIGSLLIDSISNRDMLAVQGVVVVLVGITLVLNLVVDLLYTVIDPRIRHAA